MDKVKKFFNDISDSWTNEDDNISLIRELIKLSPINENEDKHYIQLLHQIVF